MTQYWLLKSEPQVYSLSQLQAEQQTIWDGVRNYQARNFLRQMLKGDLAFFYHSNISIPGIVGLVKITATNVVDPSQFKPESPYYDPQATMIAPRWQTVVVEFVEAFPEIISLKKLKAEFTPKELLLNRRGNRLSVLPVETKIAQRILELAATTSESFC